jgi:ABC-type Zn uptake system ZnuABC Zn-binding protein ZnuA
MISIEQHGKEPNLKSLDKTILLAKQKDIDTVFYQQEFPREKAATIASEIGATAVPLSLLDEDYFNMMNNLLEIFDDIL